MTRPDRGPRPARRVIWRPARPAGRALAVAVLLAGLACASCGSKSAPTSPTSSSPSPPTLNACGIINGSTSQMLGILNGSACSTANTSVVKLNLWGKTDPVGACSGTIIAPRAVLTAAHCLVDSTDPVATVKVYLGSGAQLVATSFQASPLYNGTNSSSLDVGVVLTGEDMNRSAVPLLLSRDAVSGEQAIIAGWGQDQSGQGSSGTLRAGTTTISAIGNYYLQTRISSSASGVCSGDSGGPLLLSQGGAWALAGVTSATSANACTSGTDYYANLRNPDITSFVLSLVPDAIQK